MLAASTNNHARTSNLRSRIRGENLSPGHDRGEGEWEYALSATTKLGIIRFGCCTMPMTLRFAIVLEYLRMVRLLRRRPAEVNLVYQQ